MIKLPKHMSKEFVEKVQKNKEYDYKKVEEALRSKTKETLKRINKT